VNIPTADTVDAAQLRQLMLTEPDLRILDVRTGGEFEGAHIEGSYNVPLDTLAEHVRDLADIRQPVVLVCKSGGRATAAHAHLSEAGKDGLHILAGGIDGWMASGGDVIRNPTERWALDRQVRLAAGGLIVGFSLLSLVVPALKWLAAAVGFGLAFSAVTNTCTMGLLLSKLPYNRTDRCDIAGVLREMDAASVAPDRAPEAEPVAG
jgi:rhodanese-related sulfurtransferase